MKYRVEIMPGRGSPIGADEPCFVIRATDAFAVRAVEAYIELTRDIVSLDMTKELFAHRDRIAHWQIDNPPKLPD